VLGRLKRVFLLAGQHYVWSWALWLLVAPFMIGGLLFTEIRGPWTTSVVVGVLIAGVSSHLVLGGVLLLARPAVFQLAGKRAEVFAWCVIATLFVAGAARGVTVGVVERAVGVGEIALSLRIPTSVALVVFSYTLVAYSFQLWSDYRHKRQELLLSLLVGESSRHRHDTVMSTLRGGGTDDGGGGDVKDDIEATRQRTIDSLSALRRQVISGDLPPDSANEFFLSSDSDWRDTSHVAWEKLSPSIPRMSAPELIRTWSSSKPFSAVVIAVGPLFGVARTLDQADTVDRWVTFGVWLVGVVLIVLAANSFAATAKSSGPAALLGAWMSTQAVPVWLGLMMGADPGVLLQLWFVAFVSSSAALVLGFPPALEREGQNVLTQLEKRVDQATLDAIRSQSEIFVASQRVANYLHAEVRGHFLRLSMSLRQALDRGDSADAVKVLDELSDLLTQVDLDNRTVSPQANLLEFLTNWSRMICVSHNVDRHSPPPGIAIALEAIVMEAVNDAVRHGGATSIRVDLNDDDGLYTLVVTSNGDVRQSVFAPGLGTRILDQFARGRWSREVNAHGEYCLTVSLCVDEKRYLH
jgi:hypothetical protein